MAKKPAKDPLETAMNFQIFKIWLPSGQFVAGPCRASPKGKVWDGRGPLHNHLSQYKWYFEDEARKAYRARIAADKEQGVESTWDKWHIEWNYAKDRSNWKRAREIERIKEFLEGAFIIEISRNVQTPALQYLDFYMHEQKR